MKLLLLLLIGFAIASYMPARPRRLQDCIEVIYDDGSSEIECEGRRALYQQPAAVNTRNLQQCHRVDYPDGSWEEFCEDGGSQSQTCERIEYPDGSWEENCYSRRAMQAVPSAPGSAGNILRRGLMGGF